MRCATDQTDGRENCLILTGETTTGKTWLLKPLGLIFVAHACPSKDCRFPLVGARGWAALGEEAVPALLSRTGRIFPLSTRRRGRRPVAVLDTEPDPGPPCARLEEADGPRKTTLFGRDGGGIRPRLGPSRVGTRPPKDYSIRSRRQ